MSVAMVLTILASAWWTRDQIRYLPTSRAGALKTNVLRRSIAEAKSA